MKCDETKTKQEANVRGTNEGGRAEEKEQKEKAKKEVQQPKKCDEK